MDAYVTIHGWMLELGLNGRELNALAVVWSFGKGGEWFTGSASYLCKWMGVKNKHTAISALSSLGEKGILDRRERWENGQRLCDYRPCQKLTRGMSRNSTGGVSRNSTGGMSKFGIHNNRPDKNRPDNDSDKKEIYKEIEIVLTPEEFLKSHR